MEEYLFCSVCQNEKQATVGPLCHFLGNLYADSWAHAGNDRAGSDEDAFARRAFRFAERLQEDVEVFQDFRFVHGRLGDHGVDVSCVIVFEAELSCLLFCDDLANLCAHRVRLWVWHESLWTKDFCSLGELWHHAWR